MDILKLFSDLQVMIASLQNQLADANAAAEALAKQKFDEGFAAGVASVPVSDKLYTQSELDAAVESAVSPFRERVSGLESQVVALQSELDALKSGMNAQIAQAIESFKSEMLTKVQDLKGQLDASEDQLLDLFKPAPAPVEPAPPVEEPAPVEPSPEVPVEPAPSA